VLSHHVWQLLYGSDTSVVGSTFTVEGQPFTIVGIAPPGFFGARGYPLLDGGSGFDKYDLEGNVNIVTRGAESVDESIEPAYVP